MAQELADKIRAAAQAKGIDPEIALRIARAESANDPTAKAKTSSAGGLFQVVDKTWKEFGGKPGKKFDADENIRVGTDIISSNTNFLRKALNRDPRPAEVYAAHYFGPSGAKSFLTADPATPIVDILGKAAVKANPNLKGKNVGQVMAQLETKMGGPAPAPAKQANVSRETPPPQKFLEPNPLEPLAPAAAAPDTGGSRMADLGPGYQAALALSFLADTDDKEDRDIDREPGIAERWLAEQPAAPSVMSQFADVSIKSPFAEPKPQMLASGGMVQRLSNGGLPFTPTAMVRPSARRQLDEIKAEYDRYNAQVGDYNTQADAYAAQENAYNAAVEAYNAGERTEDFTGVAPVAPTAPTTPGTSIEQYEALGQKARNDVKNRNLALQVASDPRQFGLMGMEKFFADGGEVKEPGLLSVPTYSKTVSYEMYPGQQGQFDQRDAARHMLASGTLARKYGEGAAEVLGKLHEIGTSPMRYLGSKLGISEMPIDYEQDLHNNRVGIELGKRSKSQKELEDLVQQMAEQARGEKTEGKAWKGKPVRRADGGPAEPTPEEIAAASRPATMNPMIQRQGEAARRLAAMRDVNTLPDPKTYAAVSGFLGQAPDELGFSAMHPDAEGIKRAGQVGFGVGTALQVAPIVGGAMKLANIGPSSGGKATAASQLGAVKVPGKVSEPIFSPIPSASAPFVGRLDEMVANLQGPVQKDQFLGMLKGKMRDYDIARAETTLADLPGNAKLNPVDLLNRIKTQYDPSQFKTTIIPPGRSGDYYQSMDNPYKNDRPLGVIHLSQDLPQEAAAQQERLKEAGLALSRIATHGGYSAANPQVADDLFKFLQNPGVPLSEATSAKMADVAQGFRKAAEFDKGWEAAKNSMMYSILDKRWSPLKEKYARELAESQGKSLYAAGIQDTAAGLATRDIALEGNQWLANNGFKAVNLPDFTTVQNPVLHVASDPDMLKAVTQTFDDAREANKQFLKGLKEEAKQARMMFGNDTRMLSQYEGQHPSLKNPPSPISFSRFSEHTTEIPGIGKADGIYVNELQSDLLDDLRKKGPKGGSREKDAADAKSLEAEIAVSAQKVRDAQAAGNEQKAAQLSNQHNGLVTQYMRIRSRAKQGGDYDLPESFAGMETSPQVAQQLMVKNAVSGAMQMGKQFVAFPGAESAQAQLYEKLGPNLKAAVKDLGPGFELRDVTLRDSNGRELMHKAIVWGPDAAARVQKKGVPFKDGGAVERQTADHRKYL